MNHSDWRRRGRIALGVAFSAAMISTMLTTAAGTAAATPTQGPADEGPGIGKHDQELLAKAEQSGEKTVKVLIATKQGDAAGSVDQLTKAGAKVEYRADEIGYVRAEVPTSQVKKVAK
ncbi:MAG: serine protease, partial [Actinomycetota bacterium]|nr:serine protease [Actinomycetota bacterium]